MPLKPYLFLFIALVILPATAFCSNLWMGCNLNSQHVFIKVNPLTGAVLLTITNSGGAILNSTPLQGIAFGGTNLWLECDLNSHHVFERVNPLTGAVVQTITNTGGGIPNTATVQSITYGGTNLWLECNLNLHHVFAKIDPATGAILQTTTNTGGGIPDSTAIQSIAYGNGNLWMECNLASQHVFEKVNPNNGVVLQTITNTGGGIPNSAAIQGITYGDGNLWMECNLNSHHVYEEVNSGSGAVVQTTTNSGGAVPNTVVIQSIAFEQQWSIVASASPVIGGNITGAGAYDDGASATVTAIPDSCYSFVSWTESGSVVSTSAAYTFTASANRTLVANFTQSTYTLTTASLPSVGGTVTNGGAKLCGSIVPVGAIASSGYIFNGWTGSGSGSYTGTNNPAIVTVNTNIIETANFALPPTLTGIFSNKNLVITWPTNLNGFSLKATSILSSGVWPPFTGVPQISGTNYRMTILTTGKADFFKLEK